jgi:hypothetical protein
MKRIPFKCKLGHVTIRKFNKAEQTYSRIICEKEIFIEEQIINTLKSNNVHYTKSVVIGTEKCKEVAVRF